MPEQTVLICDAPGCNETGEWCQITIDGRTVEVILGPKHCEVLVEIMKWGRPARARISAGRTKRRGTDEARLLKLIDADKPK